MSNVMAGIELGHLTRGTQWYFGVRNVHFTEDGATITEFTSWPMEMTPDVLNQIADSYERWLTEQP